MTQYMDNKISALLWQPIFHGGDRRVLDLIIAYRAGWRNIHWQDDGWVGDDPNCEYNCISVIPHIHNSVSKLESLIRRDIDPDTLCIYKNGSISVDKKFYHNKTLLDNLLWCYMEYISNDI